jgi:hypothetical protein
MDKESFGYIAEGLQYVVEVETTKRFFRNKYVMMLVAYDRKGKHVLRNTREVLPSVRGPEYDRIYKKFENLAEKYSLEDKAPLFRVVRNGNSRYMIAIKKDGVIHASGSEICPIILKDDFGVEYYIIEARVGVFYYDESATTAMRRAGKAYIGSTWIDLSRNNFNTEEAAKNAIENFKGCIKSAKGSKEIKFV